MKSSELLRRAGAVVVLSTVANFAIDAGPKVVNAQWAPPRSTPTLVPTIIPTPNALETRITQAQNTLDNLNNARRQEAQLAGIQARIDSITLPTASPSPRPTSEPTLSPNQVEARRVASLGARQAEIQATATADAVIAAANTAVAQSTKDARLVNAQSTAIAIQIERQTELRAAQGGINVEREILKGQMVAFVVGAGLIIAGLRFLTLPVARRNPVIRVVANEYALIRPRLRNIWVIGRIF